MSDHLRAEVKRALTHAATDNGTSADGAELVVGRLDDLADAVMAVLDEAIIAVLHEHADLIDAVDPQCTALTGPYWFGQGWHQAADHLHDLADSRPYRARRQAAS
jgi:hypothetical protein